MGMGVGSSFWRRVVLLLFVCVSTPKVGDCFVFKSHKWVRFSFLFFSFLFFSFLFFSFLFFFLFFFFFALFCVVFPSK